MTNHSLNRAISTVVVAVVIVIIIIAAGVGIYLATSTSKSTTVTTTTSQSTTSSSTPSSTTTGSSSITPVSCNINQLVFCFPAIPKGSNATLSNNQTVTIGVLTDLTDGLSSIGVGIGAATQLAAQKVNAWIAANDTSWEGSVNFKVDVLDYKLSSQTALTDLSTLQSDGVSVAIGPLDSGTVGAVYSTAASDNIVLISPSSTSVLLAGVSPYVYRTVPNDAFQGQADAREMYQSGVRNVIIVYTNQAYGSGLANATSARFKALGGNVTTTIPYPATTTDFTSVLTSLSSAYTTAVSNAGGNKSNVAIFAIGYQEIGTLLNQAQTQGYGSTLLNTTQPWYGSDGEAANAAFTNTTSGVATVSAMVRLPSTLYAPTNTSDTNTVCQEINAMSSGGCSGYSLGAYDDVWLAAVSILQCGENKGTCISTAVGHIANESVGVTGPETLGSNHDRVAYAYDIFAVATVSNAVTWVLAGNWTVTTDKVTWNSNQPKF